MTRSLEASVVELLRWIVPDEAIRSIAPLDWLRYNDLPRWLESFFR